MSQYYSIIKPAAKTLIRKMSNLYAGLKKNDHVANAGCLVVFTFAEKTKKMALTCFPLKIIQFRITAFSERKLLAFFL